MQLNHPKPICVSVYGPVECPRTRWRLSRIQHVTVTLLQRLPSQEVTPLIQDVLMALPWWQQYNASEPPPSAPYYTLLLTKREPPGSAGADSISSSNGCSTARSPSPAGASAPGFARLPYANSRMGRGLDVAQCTVAGRRLLVATTHLESPMPPTNMFSEQRTAQLAGALEQLHARPAANVLLAGDMNWCACLLLRHFCCRCCECYSCCCCVWGAEFVIAP